MKLDPKLDPIPLDELLSTPLRNKLSKFLQFDESLKDDDVKLVFYVQAAEMGCKLFNPQALARFLSTITCYELACKIAKGEVSAFDYITRERRKLQEPERLLLSDKSVVPNFYRGQRHLKKQLRAEKVRQDIHYKSIENI